MTHNRSDVRRLALRRGFQCGAISHYFVGIPTHIWIHSGLHNMLHEARIRPTTTRSRRKDGRMGRCGGGGLLPGPAVLGRTAGFRELLRLLLFQPASFCFTMLQIKLPHTALSFLFIQDCLLLPAAGLERVCQQHAPEDWQRLQARQGRPTTLRAAQSSCGPGARSLHAKLAGTAHRNVPLISLAAGGPAGRREWARGWGTGTWADRQQPATRETAS